MEITHAILELVAVQGALLAASNDFAYAYYPPYQWSQSGSVSIGGATWTYEKQYSQGYRFENEQHVVLELDDILAYTADSVSAPRLGGYLASKRVDQVTLERETVAVDDPTALAPLLAKLAQTGFLERDTDRYNLVRHVDLSKPVALAHEIARDHFKKALDPIAIEAVFRELLWGPRQTWKCFVDGSITRQEATNLLVAHLDSRLVRTADRSIEWNDSTSARLCFELWRILPPTGPAALSIELAFVPPTDPVLLAARDYDPELDNIKSILHDVCEHLQDHRVAELTYRIGTTYVPVDVRIDLCVLVEQLPAAISALAEKRDFEIDNYEQSFETKLVFERRGEDYAMTVLTARYDLPTDGSIGADELLEMLLRVRSRFIAALRMVAPHLERHPWMHAWLGVVA